MKTSTSAPLLARGVSKSSSTPGKGWAKLKTNLRTQRVVKSCCGVDMWEIYDHFEEDGGTGSLHDSIGDSAVEGIRKSMMKRTSLRPEGQTPGTTHLGAPKEIADALLEALDMRAKMSAERGGSGTPKVSGEFPDTVCDLSPPDEAVMASLRKLWTLSKNPDIAAFCRVRLSLLESKFNVWTLECRDQEMIQQQGLKNDFLTVPKVDTHLHNSAMMTAKQVSGSEWHSAGTYARKVSISMSVIFLTPSTPTPVRLTTLFAALDFHAQDLCTRQGPCPM